MKCNLTQAACQDSCPKNKPTLYYRLVSCPFRPVSQQGDHIPTQLNPDTCRPPRRAHIRLFYLLTLRSCGGAAGSPTRLCPPLRRSPRLRRPRPSSASSERSGRCRFRPAPTPPRRQPAPRPARGGRSCRRAKPDPCVSPRLPCFSAAWSRLCPRT